jgi:hypothetical protein
MDEHAGFEGRTGRARHVAERAGSEGRVLVWADEQHRQRAQGAANRHVQADVRGAAKEAAGAAVDALLCWLGRVSWSIDRFSEEHETAFGLIAVALIVAAYGVVGGWERGTLPFPF